MLEEICREIDGDIISASCCAFTGRAGLYLFVCVVRVVRAQHNLKRTYGLATVNLLLKPFNSDEGVALLFSCFIGVRVCL